MGLLHLGGWPPPPMPRVVEKNRSKNREKIRSPIFRTKVCSHRPGISVCRGRLRCVSVPLVQVGRQIGRLTSVPDVGESVGEMLNLQYTPKTIYGVRKELGSGTPQRKPIITGMKCAGPGYQCNQCYRTTQWATYMGLV